MSWNETHLRAQVVREVEDGMVARAAGSVPWREGWTPLFGDAAGLATFLRYRWLLRLADQADTLHPALLAATRGLAVLDREERGCAAAS